MQSSSDIPSEGSSQEGGFYLLIIQNKDFFHGFICLFIFERIYYIQKRSVSEDIYNVTKTSTFYSLKNLDKRESWFSQKY